MELFLDAAHGTRGWRPPVWFMRQAGRSLPEYRDIRQEIGMFDACLTPEVAAEITVQPVRRHGVDAAVFFSDIMVPVKLAGVDVEIVPGVGPVCQRPAATAADVEWLVAHGDADLDVVEQGVAKTRDLTSVPVIGFAGAPFTVAAYLVEGRPSRDHLGARALMHADPGAWDTLMRWAAAIGRRFIDAQVAGGASVVQVFDSWAGSLSRDDYEAHVLPYTALMVEGLSVPVIHFGTGTTHVLDLMASCADVLGVDYRISLADAAIRAPGKPLQGNIDPGYLAAPWERLREHIDAVCVAGGAAPAHILNLGHGVPPTTDPGVLTRIVDYVKERAS